MTAGSNRVTHPSRRAVMAGGAAALGANLLAQPAAALTKTAGQPPVAPDRPPTGYNILFILVDQEHFFDPWPFPVPGREWIRQNGITFSQPSGGVMRVLAGPLDDLYRRTHPAHRHIRQSEQSSGSRICRPR